MDTARLILLCVVVWTATVTSAAARTRGIDTRTGRGDTLDTTDGEGYVQRDTMDTSSGDEHTQRGIFRRVEAETTTDAEANPLESAPRPGLKARITQKGFDFVSTLAINILMKELKKLTIPDVETEVGPTEVSVKNIRVTRFPRPNSGLAPIPWPGYGLRWHASGLSPTIQADYTANFDIGFWTIRKSGTLIAEADKMAFHLDFFMGSDTEGRPTAEVLNCKCKGGLDIDFEGQWSDLLNVGSTLFNKQIENLVTAQICFQAKKEINSKLGEQFRKMPLTHVLAEEYVLDLSMDGFPNVQVDAMEIGLKGSVSALDSPQEPPFTPPEMEIRHQDTQKMFYASLTDYTVNSAFYATFLNDLLAYDITADMVPEEHRGYLNTTCTTGLCMGTIFTQATELFPDAVAGVGIKATSPPHIDILGNAINVTATGSANVFVQDNDTQHSLFVLGITINGSFELSIIEKTVFFELVDIVADVGILGSSIGDIGSGFFFESILRVVTQQVLKPKIEELGQKGFGIPKVKGLDFVEPIIVQSETPGVFIVGTDVAFEVKKKRLMAKKKAKKRQAKRKRGQQ